MPELPVAIEVAPHPNERRRHTRVQIDVPGILLDLASLGAAQPETVRVIDISESGVRFRTSSPTRLGPHFRLHVQLPDRVETLPEFAVVSRRRIEEGFAIRCEFEDLSLTGRQLVDRARRALGTR